MGQGPSAEANFIINARLSQSSVQQVTQQINQLIEQNQNRTLNFKVNWSTGRGGGVSSAANVASQSSAAGRVAPPVIPAQVMESALAGQLPGQTAGYWAQGASPVAGGFGIPPSGYEGAWSTSGTYNFVNRSARGPGGRFIDYASWRAQQQANTEYSYAGIGRDIDEVASQIGDLFVKHFTAPDRATAKVFRGRNPLLTSQSGRMRYMSAAQYISMGEEQDRWDERSAASAIAESEIEEMQGWIKSYPKQAMQSGIRRYWQDMESNPELRAGFQTWMGFQPPLSFAEARIPAQATVKMSRAQLPTGKTMRMSADQLGIADWRADYLSRNPFARVREFMESPFAMRAGEGMLYAAGSAISAYGQFQVQSALTGRPDPLGAWGAGASLAGGLIGGIVGGVFPNTFGPIIGAHIGAEALSSVVQAAIAPTLAVEHRLGGAIPGGSLLAGLSPGGYGTFNTIKLSGYRFGMDNPEPIILPTGTAGAALGIFNWAGTNIEGATGLYGRILNQAGGRTELAPTPQDIISGAGQTISAMIAGGMNPAAIMGNAPTVRGMFDPSAYANFYRHADDALHDRGRGFPLIEGLVGVAGMAVAGMPTRFGGEPEAAYQRFERIGYQRYLRGWEDVRKSLLPVLAASPETGDNLADIMVRFGGTTAWEYARAFTEPGEPDPISLTQLAGASRRYRSAGRTVRLASTRARGVGQALAQGYADEMTSLLEIPGGTESEAFAVANAHRREARIQAYEEQNITGFEIPMTRLRGARARANVLPFNPAGIFGLDLQMMQHNEAQVGRLRGQMSALRRSGDLSEATELRYTQMIEQLQLEVAQSKAELGEMWPNRLPAYSAGRPSFFQSFTSDTLAAATLGAMRSPMRWAGAVGGRQHAQQERWARSIYSGDLGPTSQTQAMNDSESVLILRDIRDLLRNGGGKGAFNRASEATGSAAAHLGRKDLGRDDLRRSGAN